MSSKKKPSKKKPSTKPSTKKPAAEAEALVTLATRIPKVLHHDLRVHSVETGVSQMDFVKDAIEVALRRAGGRAQ